MENSHGVDTTVPAAHFGQALESLSHDLRAPSRHVKSFAQLLTLRLGTGIDDESREYLDLIDTAADKLHAKLDAVARLATAVTAAFEPEDCLVGELVQEVLTALNVPPENWATINGIDQEVSVNGDRALLVEVVGELVGNSLKFGDDPTSVRVTASVVGEHCVITVTDSGPGFTASDPTKAFDLFKRFHDESHAGVGAGLTIARTILDRHNCKIDLDSDPSAGTSVSFAVPVTL